LFGSDDTEATVRLITLLLVLVLDPLAVLLTIAAAGRSLDGCTRRPYVPNDLGKNHAR
jgi:hypothetical protein